MIRIQDTDGNVLGNLTGDDQSREVLQAYADRNRISLTMVDSNTGEIVGGVTPVRRAHNAFRFERKQIIVRVHPDDAQSIRDTAKKLNKIRQEQS
mgnify:CR=1 FL=1|tara:strand:+ start:434 stop:718 length:285 start_codon:yes stop_codon:yes gene_type:complete